MTVKWLICIIIPIEHLSCVIYWKSEVLTFSLRCSQLFALYDLWLHKKAAAMLANDKDLVICYLCVSRRPRDVLNTDNISSDSFRADFASCKLASPQDLQAVRLVSSEYGSIFCDYLLELVEYP